MTNQIKSNFCFWNNISWGFNISAPITINFWKRFIDRLELIGNIDESGYLSRSITSMVDDFLFRQNLDVNEEEIEKVLHIIQNFEPSGVEQEIFKNVF